RHVRQVMGGVRQQGEGVCGKAEDDLGHDKAEVQADSDGKCAVVACRRMAVIVAVAVRASIVVVVRLVIGGHQSWYHRDWSYSIAFRQPKARLLSALRLSSCGVSMIRQGSRSSP